MVLLAAHTVLMASKHNPTYVAGLDIAFCERKGIFRPLDEGEKEGVIKSASQSLNDQWMMAFKGLSETQMRHLL
jgi:hypothetical protein